MKRMILVAAAIAASFWLGDHSSVARPLTLDRTVKLDNGAIGRAFENRTSDVQVEGIGAVTRLLADDNNGSRHQRFIVRLTSGQTLLVAHNIDIAPRVANLRLGDNVRFFGEYVWNAQGGIIHWTHRDPQGKHISGWLKHNGRTYQ